MHGYLSHSSSNIEDTWSIQGGKCCAVQVAAVLIEWQLVCLERHVLYHNRQVVYLTQVSGQCTQKGEKLGKGVYTIPIWAPDVLREASAQQGQRHIMY